MSLQEKFDLLLKQDRNRKKEKSIVVSNVVFTKKDISKYSRKNILVK